MPSAAKVGALVVVFGVLLYLGFAFLGRSLFGQSTNDYFAEFADVTGIRPGTPVQIAGVKIGEVVDIRLADPHRARLTLRLAKDSKIPSGSAASIPSSLVGIGESPVSIDPPSTVAGYLQPGATIPGRKLGPLDNMLPEGRETVAELGKTLRAVRGLLEDKKLTNQVQSLMATTEQTAKNIGDLTAQMNKLLATNQQGLALALQRVNQILLDTDRAASQIAAMASDPKVKTDALAILHNVRQSSAKVDSLLADVRGAVNDPELRGNINRAAANVADITDTGKRIADNTERITANGAVISEKAIGVTDQVSKIASQASDIASDVKQLTNRVSGILNPKPKPGLLSQVSIGMDLFHETDPGYWRADVDGQFPFQDNTVHFGLYDAFNTNKLTFQLGNQANSAFGYRYGIYAGKAGVGVDYRVARRLSLRSDFWNLNDPRLDVRARYDFGNGLIGWLGIDRLFRDNAPTIGVGVRR